MTDTTPTRSGADEAGGRRAAGPFRCPACSAPPRAQRCPCGEMFDTFPLLACPTCGRRDTWATCADCAGEAPLHDWLDPTRATPVEVRAAKDGEVVLPSHVTPRFPERCVGCCRAITSGTLELKALASSFASRWLYGWLLAPLLSRKAFVFPPACGACAQRHGRNRTLRWLLSWGLAIATYFVAVLALGVERRLARWIAVGVWVVGVGAGVLALDTYVELEVDDSRRTATYTFDHHPYALEFARLNDGAD